MRFALAALAGLLVAGCVSPFDAKVRDAEMTLGAAVDNATRVAEQSTDQGSHSRTVHGFWFGDQAVPVRYGDPLPQALTGSGEVALFVPSNTGRSKLDLFTRARSLVPYPIGVDPSTLFIASTDGGPDALSLVIPEAGSVFAADTDPSRFIRGGYLEGDLDFPFDFSGTLSELVSGLASSLGFAGWYFESGQVFLYLHQRRDFEYRIFDDDEQFWTEGENLIRSVCSGRCAITPLKSLSRFTVVADPHILDRVTLALNALNRRLTESFVIDLKLYKITSNFQDTFDFDLGAILDGGLVRGRSPGTGVEPLLPGVPVLSPIGPGFSVGAIVSGGFLQGSTAMFSALSELGNVAELTSTSLVVLNAREQQFVIDSEQTVLLQSQETPVEGGDNVVQNNETATRNTGISVTVRPHLVGDTHLLLDVALDLKTVPIASDAAEGAGQAAVLSVQDSRRFSHQLRVRLGDLLVLNAHQVIETNRRNRGVGRPDFVLLGGGRNLSKTVTSYILTLRPVRLSEPSRASSVAS